MEENWRLVMNDFLNDPKEQYIICSAIWFKDGKNHIHQPKNIDNGFVICGRRHHNVFYTIAALGIDLSQVEFEERSVQGFLTSDDLFVDRIVGAEIALKSGQTKDLKKMLFSEDLY